MVSLFAFYSLNPDAIKSHTQSLTDRTGKPLLSNRFPLHLLFPPHAISSFKKLDQLSYRVYHYVDFAEFLFIAE